MESITKKRRGVPVRVLVALAMLLTLLLAACGDDDAASDDGEDTAANGDTGDTSDDDWEPEWVDGVLQPLPSGWPSDDLVLVNRGEPTSRNGLLMRALRDAADPRAPVNVVVEDVPGGGGHSGWDFMKDVIEDHPDGSGVMIISMSGHTATYHQNDVPNDTGLVWEDLRMLTRLEATPYVVVLRQNAEWGETWEDLVEYARENPGAIRYMSPPVGGGVDVAMQGVLDELGISPIDGMVEQIPVGQEEGVIAVGAGEGDFAITDAGTVRPHYEAGVVNIGWTTATEVMEPFNENPDVQTAQELGFTDYYHTDLGLLIAPDAPDAHVRWFEELLREAHSDADYEAARRNTVPGVEFEFWGPDEAQEHLEFLFDLTDRVLRRLDMHIES